MHIASCDWWNINWYTKSGINDLYLYLSIEPLSTKKKKKKKVFVYRTKLRYST